jgi:hypothetical protein
MQRNCKNREKFAKNARKLHETHKICSQNARQIVENGVDQVDLGEVGTSGNEEEKKKRKKCFFRARSGLFSRRFPCL